MTAIGGYALFFSFLLSIAVLASFVVGLKRKDGRFIDVGYRGTKVVFLSITAASLLLVYAFLTDDFRIQYVASYSERALPLFYKITGLWAGQKGSLLFWTWLLSLFTFITIVRDEKKPNTFYLPYVLVFLNITMIFFLFLVNFITRPFELSSVIPADGNGLNPLLQNPGMVFHPPTLYLGYVGFAVPFAFAMAALVMKELGDWWIKRTRGWILFSWVFLTLGIVFGGWWAYRELGWGGVWAWDPVENASLMPWFTATAFLHSVIIQERRGMLKVWNLVLILLTFSLSIFGTFITRSGIITSVHAFGQSSVGYVFLAFLLIIVTVGIYLIWTRYDMLKEKNPRIESFVSKESAFLYNNIILLGLAFATFWGTIFPLISEAVKGVKISVGPPFFNRVNSPLFLLLLVLMSVCPLLAWRRTSLKGAVRNLLIPASLMLLSLPLLYLSGISEFMPLFFYSFSLFVIVSLLREFYIGTRSGVKHRGERWFASFINLISNNRRRYGGFVVHIGIVFVIVGLTGYGYFQYKENYTLVPGEQAKVKDYTLKFEGLQSLQGRNYSSLSALVKVYKSGKFQGIMKPEKRFYKREQPTTEVAIKDSLFQDLYLILSGWENDGSVTLTVVINPFLSWAWVGTGVIVLGTIWAVIPRRRKEWETELLEKDLILYLKGVKGL
ncbi:cytochrome c-type biogenesis protein CcmF [bacterium BMS3Bbin06]|nr:cytochrome c-type biogenesis protein CcmF [bacterium BMS3Abin08]GBE34875.1 cytochrome c-type biogenesis protein CcmF [bacterium BMS3Bbin06]HDO35888.1 heme lyase CcmF/NrfE family subunit [Nitrospirota bacterium]HDY71837.1 heme lyase CcmF/NrfE family subunit [Nitrospirota bacterium]